MAEKESLKTQAQTVIDVQSKRSQAEALAYVISHSETKVQFYVAKKVAIEGMTRDNLEAFKAVFLDGSFKQQG